MLLLVFILRLQVTLLLTFTEIENDYCEMSLFWLREKVNWAEKWQKSWYLALKCGPNFG